MLINDFFQPSRTLGKEDDQVVTAARNMQFGLICAACFDQRWAKDVNLTVSSLRYDSYLVKKPPHGKYWKSGKNYCAMTYTIVRITDQQDFLKCSLRLGSKEYTRFLEIFTFVFDFSDGGGGSFVRERAILTKKTKMDCRRESDQTRGYLDPKSTNTTVWWYQRKGESQKIPRYISNNSSYPGGIPVGIGDKIGCATIEMTDQFTMRTYEKIYTFDGNYDENDSPGKEALTSRPNYQLKTEILSSARVIFGIGFGLTLLFICGMTVKSYLRKRRRGTYEEI